MYNVQSIYFEEHLLFLASRQCCQPADRYSIVFFDLLKNIKSTHYNMSSNNEMNMEDLINILNEENTELITRGEAIIIVIIE